MPSVYSGVTLPSHFGNTCFPVALMGGTLTLMQNQEVLIQYMLFGVSERLVSGGSVYARCWVLRDRNNEASAWLDCSSGPFLVHIIRGQVRVPPVL